MFFKSKSTPTGSASGTGFIPTLTESQVLTALSKVMDPDLHRDIVSLGFIKNLKTPPYHLITVTLILMMLLPQHVLQLVA